ncbi:MAG: dihydroorotate dehydrogenase-like protein [Candidatus Marinimicrobia bacterium]|nr:dihydroorotate dehydrogenase-like protein [Candidatus Neomarinimicrobiota bacterium]
MRLKTSYLGFNLKNPIIPSASPLSREIDTVKQLEDAGVSAIVMYSLFEEQIRHETEEIEHFMEYGVDSFSESLSFFPGVHDFIRGPEAYLEHIRSLKDAVEIPIIASLNGSTQGGWTDYARKLQDAGADALELNVYSPPSKIDETSTMIEDNYVEILKKVKAQVTIPVSMKLGHYLTALPALAKRLEDTGVDGLALFNRFYQPDIDLEKLEVVPSVHLSTPTDMRMPLRWMAVLSTMLKVDLGATTGVHSGQDVVKLLMAGADVTFVCSALLKFGPEHVKTILDEMESWMDEHEYESVEQMKGSMSMKNVSDSEAFMRSNYMKALNKYK